MSACCDAAGPTKSSWARSARGILAWIFPSAFLVLVPKCPACLAAYVTLWTGIGLSLTTATYLRWALLVLAATLMFFLLAKRLDLAGAIFNYFKKEVEPCNTK
jgi:hypothetical protein